MQDLQAPAVGDGVAEQAAERSGAAAPGDDDWVGNRASGWIERNWVVEPFRRRLEITAPLNRGDLADWHWWVLPGEGDFGSHRYSRYFEIGGADKVRPR